MHMTSVQPGEVARSTGAVKRHWRVGLKSLLRFITTPSDLANSFEAMFALAGPTVEKEFLKFASSPTGSRLLAESPRRDLNEALMDHAALAAMSPGSFGRMYLDYLGGEDMGAADYFLEAADLEEKAARFGWSADQLWFIRRMANSHDLFHVMAGYDTDVTGEVGVIAFTAGQVPLLPLRLLLPWFMVLKPSQPARWFRFVRDCYRHGRSAPSLACVDYESLLSRPLAEVRREIGLPVVEDVLTSEIPLKGWLLSQVERNVTLV